MAWHPGGPISIREHAVSPAIHLGTYSHKASPKPSALMEVTGSGDKETWHSRMAQGRPGASQASPLGAWASQEQDNPPKGQSWARGARKAWLGSGEGHGG